MTRTDDRRNLPSRYGWPGDLRWRGPSPETDRSRARAAQVKRSRCSCVSGPPKN